MDLKNAIRVEQARNAQIEAGREAVAAAGEAAVNMPLHGRLSRLAEKAAAFVPHIGNQRENRLTREAPLIPIIKTVGPLPLISLRYEYKYSLQESELLNLIEPRFNYFNEFGERITSFTVEWVHSPEGIFNNPKNIFCGAIELGEGLTAGEVFATEEVEVDYLAHHYADLEIIIDDQNDIMQKLALVELSLEEYEKAFNKM
jgi:hypothetical protein